MPTIAVDAMGGEFAPEALVQGVAEVSLNTDIQCILVGAERRIQEILEANAYNPENIDIVDAGEVVGMDEDPREAVRRKRRSSLLVATRLVEEGRASALMTAGNPGATVRACIRYLPMIAGVRKVALAGVYPRQVENANQDALALVLDVGATIRCEPFELVQFALMGSAYARSVSKVEAPRIGLLNIGRGDGAGGEVLAAAHKRLRRLRELNFVGNVEGQELIMGRTDVAVCEGLLGNIVIKLLLGLAAATVDLTAAAAQRNWRWRAGMALSGGVDQLRRLTDYADYGGAPILGLEHVVIEAHGKSKAQAIGNAVKVAAKAARDGVAQKIRMSVADVH